MDIIQTICNDKMYLSICKRISWEHHKDLYQDAMLQVCLPETRERLEKALNEGRLETFVTGIIHTLWNHLADNSRPRQKERENSALYRITDNVDMWQDYKFAFKDDSKKRLLLIKSINELSKKINSEEKEERESAKLLWSVCHSNIHTVSKERDESFYQIKRKIAPILKDIKKKLDE